MQQSHEQPPESKQPRSRLTKATASTAAIQPLEITMTAVVTTPEENTASSSSIDGAHSSVERLQQYQQAPSIQQQQQHSRQQQQKVEQQQQHQQQSKRQDARRKQSQHRHHVKSPVFTPDNSVSPLLTPSPNAEAITFPTLPPPAKSSTIPSEAVVALQDAANGKYQTC